MEGLDFEFAEQLAGWILKEADALSMQPPAFREKIYNISDISKKQGTEKFLLHAREMQKMVPEIFQISEDLTRVRICGVKIGA